MTAARATKVASIKMQLSVCDAVLTMALSEMELIRGRLGPVCGDVTRTIGGTAQGTDASMIVDLETAQQTLQAATQECAHARTTSRRVAGML